MQVLWTKDVATMFDGEDKKALASELLKRIPSFIENDYYRIKPVRLLAKEPYPIQELRVHVKKKDYRVAFAEKGEEKIIFYVDPILKKSIFEANCRKYVNKNKNYLAGAELVKE
ncbi:hypothetical protein [Catellicoccus marimammalium]|uniref:Uncharacterized protein n=1 Tax=Catellicoccus marimammalium M35/04/3 TaxID=1234409 RepID=K8ZML8_9ENTE|nr:hypothetical protein [Catellicoccus marimammalium]EKU27788.1 hypothetical protein C683_0253 [Catellicoccus marimammalium M35/04/3]